MIRMGLFFGKNTIEMISSYHIRGTYQHDITDDANHHHLAKVVFTRLFHCKFVIFPFPYSVPWKSLCVTHTPGGGEVGLALTPRESSTYTHFWNSSIKKICLLSPVYIFNHLFVLICTHVYLFIAQIVSNLAL